MKKARGQDHPLASLTDREVALIRAMYQPRKIPYSRLANLFLVSKSCIAKIIRYERR